MVEDSTHLEGGLIDQVYYRKEEYGYEVNVDLYSPYYTATDHDSPQVQNLSLVNLLGPIFLFHYMVGGSLTFYKLKKCIECKKAI